MQLGARVTLAAFMHSLQGQAIEVPAQIRERLIKAREVVDTAAAGEAPVYGLNTGLGANLGHRIDPADIPAFQRQLIEGRAVAVGPMLPAQIGRAMLLARLIGVAQGHSGMSVPLFDHLCALWREGIAPAVPMHGSIGAADLTQNACWALAVLGQGQHWQAGSLQESADAFEACGITVPDLQAKDGMALINHSGLTVALGASALNDARMALQMAQQAAVLSCQGFGANAQIFSPHVNELRTSPGQSDMAAWFARALNDDSGVRVQDALSFRTIAPVFGAAWDALGRAIAIWEDELNGASDNPAVMGAQAMCSTSNFLAPALALALEQVSLAMAMVAQSAVMRVQRMMDPKLSGLPRYLSPRGGASAGFVPLQKTAAALLGTVRRHAMPVALDAAPVSDGVEDMAPMTPQVALKLSEQMQPFQLICGIEAVVAAQARDLRGVTATPLHHALRARIAPLDEDRALGQDAQIAMAVLRDAVTHAQKADTL